MQRVDDERESDTRRRRARRTGEAELHNGPVIDAVDHAIENSMFRRIWSVIVARNLSGHRQVSYLCDGGANMVVSGGGVGRENAGRRLSGRMLDDRGGPLDVVGDLLIRAGSQLDRIEAVAADHETYVHDSGQDCRMLFRPPTHHEHGRGCLLGCKRLEDAGRRFVTDTDIEDQR